MVVATPIPNRGATNAPTVQNDYIVLLTTNTAPSPGVSDRLDLPVAMSLTL